MEEKPLRKNNKLLNIARILRRNMTRQEKHLWYDFLRHYPVKIYKQRIIDDFIADFYCHSARLVIELDGSQHCDPQEMEYDRKRTAFLQQQGLMVLRVSNRDVSERFRGVCEYIDRTVQERMKG